MNAAPHKDINFAPHNNPPDSKKLAISTECSVPSALALSGRHPNAGKFFTPATIRRFTGGHQTVPKTWMSATGLRALFLGDPVLLWLEHHSAAHGFTRDPEEHSFLGWIGEKGKAFEAAVVRRWAPGAVQVLSEDWDVRDVNAFLKTLQALDRGHEVLTKCALWGGDVIKVYGTADIIAQSSWVYKNWPHLRPAEPEQSHFCVLDVKFMKRLDRQDKKTELLMASSQVRMYSWILGHLQGFMPPRAFLLCRDGPVAVPVGHRLGGPLDPELAALRDRHLDIKLNGANYLPGRDAIVAPGFSNLHDEPWHGAKKRIAAEFIPGRPLHWLPRVGDRQAETLGRMGVCCLDDLLTKDPQTFPFEEVPGLGPTTCAQIRAVLQANRTGQPTPVPAEDAPPRRSLEFYCDYEFLSNLNVRFDEVDRGEAGSAAAQPADLTGQGGQEMVFQIGCGWEEKGRWSFRCFTAAHENVASERAMFQEFLAFLEEKGAFRPGQEAALYHWSPAEVSQSHRASERTGLAQLTRLPWVDVQEGFRNGPVCLPGAWNFGLKATAKALGAHSPAHAVQYPSELADGLSAMVLGWEAYARADPRGSDEMRLIEQYLEIDCKSLWQVLRWLRENAENAEKSGTSLLGATIGTAPEPVARPEALARQEPVARPETNIRSGSRVSDPVDFHWYVSENAAPQSTQPRKASPSKSGAGHAGFWWPSSTAACSLRTLPFAERSLDESHYPERFSLSRLPAQ